MRYLQYRNAQREVLMMTNAAYSTAATALAPVQRARSARAQITPTPVLMIEYVLVRRTRDKISFSATSDSDARERAFEMLNVAKGMRNPQTFKAADGHKIIRVSNGQQIYPTVAAN